MADYHYTESGLDNVIIRGVDFMTADDGEEVVTIHNIKGLHRAIAAAIVLKPGAMTGRELRFLRTEMRITQADLGILVHREALAIGRWERGEIVPIDPNADALVRLHARETLRLEAPSTIAQIAAQPDAKAPATIEIDGRDTDHYQPMTMAA